ncbi:hypothetical protein SADUNF_Sadunf15G0075400 [Salix dunnii]|uniref:Uncharacterized protein n=1 Tax=Salix dunnii TaxID=1413687 RepID=A0A835MNW8_9ROSI|nr:hypothetical protein SADUNF_Sadunf15G0075400 [Salix dunnii]
MVEKVRLSCLNGTAVDLSDIFLTVSNNIISRSTRGRVYVNEGSNENFRGLSRKVINLIASFFQRYVSLSRMDGYSDWPGCSSAFLLQDMFVGGTNTIAATMEWMKAELAKNPIVMKKAQGEVRKVVGKKSKLCDKLINDEMVYLKCVLKESLRLHAPTMTARETCEAVKLRKNDKSSRV